MKKAAYMWLFLFFPVFVFTQDFFRTMVPTEPVLAGESFRVQYIIQGGSMVSQFMNPDFKPLQLINGPAIYFGEQSLQPGFKQSKNYVFTLVAASPGRYKIPGAVIFIDGKKVKSNESFVDVKLNNQSPIGNKDEREFNEFNLRSGENVVEKIQNNLFVKVTVDKTNCFPGEPVLATFKLYTRLKAQSDIVKNPGFYGFTVYDVVNLSDKMVSVENVNGRLFDVHTIRKVQLFPLQPGLYSIDAMEVKNRLEFSGDIFNKKAKQEVNEGIPGGSNTEIPEGSEIIETDISTLPVSIMVKPFIEKSKPVNFNGAVGVFNISAVVEKNIISQNEEGFLEIAIKGKGNFTQLNAPEIQSPPGFEIFEPSVKDTFDKSKTPIAGSRIFRYPFISAKQGQFIIPAISFSFFNPDSGTYRTIATNSIEVNIADAVKNNINLSGKKKQLNKNKSPYYWFTGAVLLIAGFLLFWFLKRRNRVVVKSESHIKVKKAKPIIDDLLAQVYLYIPADEKLFYNSVYTATWDYFTFHYGMIGSKMKMEILLLTMEMNGVDKNDISHIKNILEECEISIFTNVNISKNRNELVDNLKSVLTRINNSLL